MYTPHNVIFVLSFMKAKQKIVFVPAEQATVLHEILLYWG